MYHTCLGDDVSYIKKQRDLVKHALQRNVIQKKTLNANVTGIPNAMQNLSIISCTRGVG